ncbi:hypothetical protein NEMBOFW57_006289 [Staphylotrichum longicolle]|uniref:Uncharacterized protein n=1 Tax=Staphylotrichum longicolle TaxID=669026 RepID=A0AAD4F1T2_9PEZI|nr:hypothetical protein NEMBOFW57_006289 [Staphylotrichum longicolle]
MEYPNSRLAGPSPYDITIGNLSCGIPLRVHRNAELADRVSHGRPRATHDDLLQAYKVVMAGGDMDAGPCSPLTRAVVDFGKTMVAIDPVRAKETFRWVERWAKLMWSTSSDGKDCQSFDEYLEYRRVNVSAHVLRAGFGLFMFAMGLDIPDDQQQICLDLSESFWLQTSLVNDYYSWEREQKTATDRNHASMANAIWVLMEKHSISCDEAKAFCREKIRDYAAEYLRVIETVTTRDDLCHDAKFLLDVQKFAISGNAAWSLECYRYHPEQECIPAHVEIAKAVWAEDTATLETAQSKVTSGAILPDEAKVNGTLEAPSRYLDTLPAKGIRDKTIDALNLWYDVSPEDTLVIKKVVNLLHGASLMLDDIEDSSQLRRGKPAVHMVFGTMQTINSAGYRFLGALAEVRKLDSELRDLYIGQSHDLSWTYNLDCPTEEEYLAMVDNKTAGLFRMLARLMDAKSVSPAKPDVALLTRFMTLLGRLFQIRDDYMNLTSADYTKQKGFCEDLDEGKYSLPLIHALGRCETYGPTTTNDGKNTVLRNLLSQRHVAGKMSLEQKKLFLEHLRKQGSLEYTRHALDALQVELKCLAAQMGMLENDMLKGLLEALKV